MNSTSMKINIPKEVKLSRWEKVPTQEQLFNLWAEDALLKGFILGIYEQEDNYTWNVQEPIYIDYEVNRVIYKGKKNERTVTDKKRYKILDGTKYTADRQIIWHEKAHGVFFKTLEDISNGLYLDCYFVAHEINNVFVSYLDVKAPPSPKIQNCSDVSFRLKSKIIFEKYRILINKVYLLPTGKYSSTKKYLFLHTYFPYRYFLTDKLTGYRKLDKYKEVFTIDKYL